MQPARVRTALTEGSKELAAGIASSFLTVEYFEVHIRDQSKACIPRCTLSLADT
jgi:hypothetical protein